MVEVLAVAERILNAVLQALSLLGIIQGQTQQAAREYSPFDINDHVIANNDLLANTDYGLAAIAARLDALTSSGEYALANVLAVTGTPQQANDPVTLPTNPPAAYGGASADSAAAAVWEYQLFDSPWTTGQSISWTGSNAYMHNNYGIYPLWSNALIGVTNPAAGESEWPSVLVDVAKAFQDTTGDATRLAHLQRVLPQYNWLETSTGHVTAQLPFGSPSYGMTLVCLITEAQFQSLKGGGASSVVVPPVWPGLAGVTLLPAVTIVTPGGVIDTPMDGCIVEITGHPSWAGSYDFGGVTSWRNCGALAFSDDDATEEAPQTLGMTPCVYCPKTMSTAGGLVYRVAVGYAGTITPWRLLS